MNTDTITTIDILGTDSVSSSRITINNNFKKLAKAIGDIQTRIDTSKNTIYTNVIETESGDFAVRTTPNHTTRFKIDNSGNVYIGSMLLDEYIRRVVNNTKFVNLKIFDYNSSDMNFQVYSGVQNNDTGNRSKASYVTVYYSVNDYLFDVQFDIDNTLLNIYPNAVVCVYDNSNTQYYLLNNFTNYTFSFNNSTVNDQRTISILWIPGTAIQETYTFKLEII